MHRRLLPRQEIYGQQRFVGTFSQIDKAALMAELRTGISAQVFFCEVLKSVRTRAGGRYRAHRPRAAHQCNVDENHRRAPGPRHPK